MTTRKPSSPAADLLITRLIKLGGWAIAIHEAFTTRDPATFAIASFMLAGAQGAENIIRKARQ